MTNGEDHAVKHQIKLKIYKDTFHEFVSLLEALPNNSEPYYFVKACMELTLIYFKLIFFICIMESY